MSSDGIFFIFISFAQDGPLEGCVRNTVVLAAYQYSVTCTNVCEWLCCSFACRLLTVEALRLGLGIGDVHWDLRGAVL